RLTYHYLEYKNHLIKNQIEKFKNTKVLYSQKYSPQVIAEILNVPKGTVHTWLYRKPPINQYTSKDFWNFDDFVKITTEGLSKTGVVWEGIKEKKEIEPFIAQDITTISSNHNFIANSFVVGNCLPYNADFDGDEMNLHIPQTEEAIAEAETLMQVQTQIITPKNGLNVIGVIEDSISGCYLLTKELTLTREEAVELLISIGIDSGFEKFKSAVQGKDIFSVLLPDDFNFVGETKSKQPLIIKKGKIVEGFIDVNSIGEEKGTLVREIYKKYGSEKTLYIVDKIAKLGINVLLKRGFSSGLSDTDLPKEIIEKIQQQISDAKSEVDELIRRYNKGELDPLPSRTIEETLEIMILQNLNKIRNKVGDLIATQATEKNNHTIVMARSGARGNILNLAMMAAVVGQQALRGKRIKNGYDKRTLTLFKKDDKSPKSKGFIDVGFKNGLDPVQFFFGAMTGRDSLMDTALRTPKSGYLYRRLANALQDLKVEYDGTVRDATKTIIQFNYGDDNIDVSKSDGGTIDVKRIVKVVASEE
ncbi:hypothetical protein HYX19_02235, partial [Candidatus Woesearchaeota archaeon]|nr:hypothetical protein [Candidatus Woesearchaeota archaeon]